MNINIGMQAKGRVKTTLTDIRTGKKEIHEQDNLLLNSFMNEWFTGNREFLSASTMSACFLDTSNAPADPNQTGIQGSTLASNTNGVTVFSETPWNEGKLPNLSRLPNYGNGCSFSPDGKYLAVAHRDSPYITVYDTENNFEKLPNLSALSGTGWGCSFSPDGKYLAVAHDGSPSITVYDTENNFEKLPNLSALSDTGNDCSFSPDGKYLAVAHDGSPYITVYDAENNFEKFPNLSALSGIGYGCSFSPDGKYLAVAHYNSPYITVYRTEKPKTTTAQKMKRKWTFPPGTGTGEISSLVLRTSTANVWTSRVALDFPINKTEFHELEVEWEIELFFDFETEVMIPSGQIDGETDVKVTIELSPHFTHQISSLSGHRKWLQTTSPALLLGRRNTPYGGIPTIQGLQGEQVARYTNSNIREAQPYISGSLERTTRIFLETNQGNDYPIAEMVLEDFCRLRFDPPLEKDDMHRLYIDLTFKWNRGE